MPHIAAGEIVVLAASAASCVVPFLAWVLLVVWARRVGARYPAQSTWRRLWILPLASAAPSVLGTLATVTLLALSFSAVAHEAPERRSLVLADGISNAMNFTAVGTALSALLLLASVVALVVGHRGAPPAPT